METDKTKTVVTIGTSPNAATFTITSRNVGSVRGFPFDTSDDKSPRYHYRVTVKHERRQFTEDYYTSVNDYSSGKDEMSPNDHLFALQCLADEARTGGFFSFEDFCKEFGYEQGRDSRRIHNACGRIYDKFKLLGLGSEDDLIGISNHLGGEAGTDYKIQ